MLYLCARCRENEGVHEDNLENADSKGGNRGSRNGNAKLTEKKIVEMRCLRAAGCRVIDLAQVYDVGEAYVSSIVNRKVWRHV